MKLIDKINSLKTQIIECEEEIRKEVYKVINDVANEHKRPKISNHIFIINFSELSGNPWDASFYDWERSAEILLKKLNNVRALDLVNSIESIYNNRLRNGICKIKMSHREYFGCSLSNFYFKITNEYPVKTEFIKEVLDRVKLID